MTDATPALSLGPALRALRRHADLSQRELAERSGVPAGTIARIEAGRAADPRFRTVERLVQAAGRHLTIVNKPPDAPHEEVRDLGARHYPAHLDTQRAPGPRNWTYQLDRQQRDRRRAGIAAAKRVEIVHVDDGWRDYGIGHRLIMALRAEMDRTGVRRARALAKTGLAATFLQRCGFTWDWLRPIGLTLDLGGAEQPRPR